MPSHSDPSPRRAAMFVDYDNLHSVLTSQSSTDRKTSSYVLEILDEVRRYLEEGDDTPTILGRAYGAFDTRLKATDDEVPSKLYRSGFKPSYVSAETQRNASELQLSIDATRFVTKRSDLETIVLVTGNRPYLPLARWVREQDRRVLVAAVNPPHTENTPSFVEDELYLDARNLLSQKSRDDLLANAPQNGQSPSSAGSTAVPPRHYQPVTNSVARRTINITDEHFGQYDEVYLTPLLRKLSEILGPDHDPKALVSELEAAGAVRLEKREGHPHDYTVLIVNEDHPTVEEVRAEDDSTSTVVDPPPSPTEEPSEADVLPDDDVVDHDAYMMDDAIAGDSETSAADDSPAVPTDENTNGADPSQEPPDEDAVAEDDEEPTS